MKKVVIVDDDSDMRELMSLLLRDRYDVTTAADGMEGLELTRKVRPDLLILDLLMPRMHGFEVCRRIRADEELKNLKVLIASSKSYQHDVHTALEETGANGYIIKPLEAAEFNRRVDAMLGGAS